MSERGRIKVVHLRKTKWFICGKQPTIWHGTMFNTYYLKYANYETNKDKSISMFNLVAKCFVGNPHNYKYVQTINGDNSDYKASNLQWVKARRRKPLVGENTV